MIGPVSRSTKNKTAIFIAEFAGTAEFSFNFRKIPGNSTSASPAKTPESAFSVFVVLSAINFYYSFSFFAEVLARQRKADNIPGE